MVAQCSEDWHCFWMKVHPGEYCILHDPNREKDPEQFSTALDAVISDGDKNEIIRLDGVFFPQTRERQTWYYPVSFCQATFAGDAPFYGATFKEPVDFEGATFEGYANFLEAVFEGYANFYDATFKGYGCFVETTFKGYANFENATFEFEASFWRAMFEREVSFFMTRFHDMVIMGATFNYRASFCGIEKELLFANAGTVTFKDAIFNRPDLVEFSNVECTKCIFIRTDVRAIDFSSVTWKVHGRWYWKRSGIYEPEDAKPVELETAYRQIRQSYEDRRNYPEAGDFYYGEMDKKRSRYLWRRYLPSLTTLYWLCSGYGQKPFQAGVLLLILLIGFTVLALWGGVDLTENSPYQLDMNFWNLFWHYTLRTATLGAPYFVPRQAWGEIARAIIGLVVPIQFGLFFLAVNRAFKR